MPVYVAMIRGINVSGHKPVKMERLRASFESLGFSGVKTYVQSGNVIFKTAKIAETKLAAKMAEKILDDFGHSVSVLVRTPAELANVLKGNPLLKQKGIDDTRLYVTFLAGAAPAGAEGTLKVLAAAKEQYAIRGREVYLYCPNGYGTTKFSNTAIEKKLLLEATTRNWRTINALCEMASA